MLKKGYKLQGLGGKSPMDHMESNSLKEPQSKKQETKVNIVPTHQHVSTPTINPQILSTTTTTTKQPRPSLSISNANISKIDLAISF